MLRRSNFFIVYGIAELQAASGERHLMRIHQALPPQQTGILASSAFQYTAPWEQQLSTPNFKTWSTSTLAPAAVDLTSRAAPQISNHE